ncbi:phage baseplate protein [uncultured Megasphaera sp.]|uniref:phage baseplate protein n=1 Tax=uncultured Megasphaera sp. TaxID=165188 RepID=UPI0025850B77|nr:hypothetical protein [uncultured Megasphaera sp.]
MKKQAYQIPEIRDVSNNIIQAGTYGRTSPLVNADNTGILDYVNNNLEALHDAQTSGNGVRAAADTKGQAIDIAALKKLITDTVAQAKKEALLEAHPVGSYYISDKSTSPASLFGGTWQALSPGLTLIAQGKGSDTFGDFEFVAGKTYGERLHKITVEELPARTVCSLGANVDDNVEIYSVPWNTVKTKSVGATCLYDYKNKGCSDVAFDKPHNTMQPSKAVYIWIRVS